MLIDVSRPGSLIAFTPAPNSFQNCLLHHLSIHAVTMILGEKRFLHLIARYSSTYTCGWEHNRCKADWIEPSYPYQEQETYIDEALKFFFVTFSISTLHESKPIFIHTTIVGISSRKLSQGWPSSFLGDIFKFQGPHIVLVQFAYMLLFSKCYAPISTDWKGEKKERHYCTRCCFIPTIEIKLIYMDQRRLRLIETSREAPSKIRKS